MQNDKLIPISIVIAVIIVLFSFIQVTDVSFNFLKKNQEANSEKIYISKVDPEEPVLGNPEASVIFIEYSDTECPFSLAFAKEREKIISLYAEAGQIAWVYRSLPLINDASFKKGLALECVAEENKNHIFWNYLLDIQDKNIFDPKDNSVSVEMLLEPLERDGILNDNLIDCIKDERYTDKLTNNIKEAVDSGAERTPFTVILHSNNISQSKEEKIKNEVVNLPEEILKIIPDSGQIILNGKIPFENLKNIVDILIAN